MMGKYGTLTAKDALSLVVISSPKRSGLACVNASPEPPTTQFQCDEDKEPIAGFSVDSSNVLAFNGSSNFYACPATDTEYNLYVQPDFGQAKCFEVKLKASDCGAAPTAQPTPSTSTCPTPAGPSTVTETCTVTNSATVTITESTTATDTTTDVTTCTVTQSTTVNIPTTVTETCIVTQTSTTTVSIPGEISMRTETCTVTQSATVTWPITITSNLPCYSTTSSKWNTTKPTTGCHKCTANSTTLKTTASNGFYNLTTKATTSLSQY